MIIIPIFNKIILPNTKIFLEKSALVDLNGNQPKAGDKVIFLINKEKKTQKNMVVGSFYPIGVYGEIVDFNQGGFAVVDTYDRVTIQNAEDEDGKLSLTYVTRPDTIDISVDEEDKMLSELKEELAAYTSSYQWGVIAKSFIYQMKSLSELLSGLSLWIDISPSDKYRLLEEDSLRKRDEIISDIIKQGVELLKVNAEAQNKQMADDSKLYREMAIKKQINYLQNELDEMNPGNESDATKFEKKIKKSGMNEEARKEAEKALTRFKNESKDSPEHGMLYDYLDFITGLDWKKAKPKKIDLDKAQKILDEDHYGLKKVKKRIIEQIAVMDLNKKQNGSILLFAGPPGTGKTSIGKSIARALGRKYVRVSLGGVRDEADIRGHRRTYIGALPGRIMDGISKSGVSNPVMVLDEVDKLSSSYNGDPASALLEVLDPEQNNTFTDHYMNVPYDLSDVLFICTANTVDTIPEPLLNRMEVIEFNGYTPIEKFHIAKEHLIPDMYKKIGINKDELKITDGALKSLISDYTMESGVRGLKKVLEKLGRSTAIALVKGNHEPIEVTKKTIDNYLDSHKIHHDRVLATKNPGIVTGLAWTSVGGEILFIESLFTKGDGKIILTGQLGDVMKESATIAISLVKSMFPEKAKLFKENDLHIHFPEGAIKKDGPSAGITITTALASLVTGKKVDPHIAMTGEVSLRGNVMPIGGLPEKLMAAQRAGITKAFIPKENVDDLKDVADEVKDKLEIIPVNTVSDVLKGCNII